MKALTVRQPWAWAIFHGKDIENRRQAFTHRGTVLIHSGLHLADASAFTLVAQAADQPMPHLGRPGEPTECAVGAIIGVAAIVGAHDSRECGGRCSPWAETGSPLAHLELAHQRVLAQPVPALGRLGLWDVTDHAVDAAVRRELAR